MISEKGLFGLTSGVITTIILQPFENIKIALMIPPKDMKVGGNFIKKAKIASQYIFRVDGWKGFYKGLIASTMKAALGCYIYFSILRRLQQEKNQTKFMNFIFSSTARIVSCFLTNPLSIIQTRFQLADFHQYKSVRGALNSIYHKEGFYAFFNGALASCIKQGIFAGCYYMIYLEMKKLDLSKLIAGIFSGLISTILTHPLQIIRAKLQTIGLTQKHNTLSQHLIMKQFKLLRDSKDWFKGIAPRLLKKPLANTLTFFIFQNIEDIKQTNSKFI